jgi:2-polyprenyl-3-methyl-5-hydroxy-6-metoxy-1,4-benzoquinol methylase
VRAADDVRRYFSEGSNVFLGLYDGQLSPVQRVATAIFREGVRQRFVLALEMLGEVAGRRILDVGCGAGPLAIALAERGAHVTGIDVAPPMIRKAETLAATLPAARRPRFVVGDFFGSPLADEPWDAVVALGVADYLEDPTTFLRRAAAATRGRLVVSFPAAWRPQNPLRRAWLGTKRCRVYFYTGHRVATLGADLGLAVHRVVPFRCGHLLVGDRRA